MAVRATDGEELTSPGPIDPVQSELNLLTDHSDPFYQVR